MNQHPASGRKRLRWIVAASAAIVVAAGVGVTLSQRSAGHGDALPVDLPTTPQSYLGVYTPGSPASYDGVTAFANATGSRPDLVMYYSGWFVPFPAAFAATAAGNGAVPLVQMDPDNISVAKIAAGRYDGYLSAYAEAVRAYRHPVIISFGHEMNGNWSTWGYQNTSPKVFVAAWRHIVTLFRNLGASDVTWLWTVNIIDDTQQGRIPAQSVDQALRGETLDEAGDVAVRHHHAPGEFAERHAVGGAVELRHQVEARERDVEGLAQAPAHLAFDQHLAGEQPQPQAQLRLVVVRTLGDARLGIERYGRAVAHARPRLALSSLPRLRGRVGWRFFAVNAKDCNTTPPPPAAFAALMRRPPPHAGRYAAGQISPPAIVIVVPVTAAASGEHR